jgi:hypothetical protein
MNKDGKVSKGGMSTGAKTPEGKKKSIATLRAGWLRCREGLYINPCLIMLSAILMMASSFDRGSHPKTVLMRSVEIF